MGGEVRFWVYDILIPKQPSSGGNSLLVNTMDSSMGFALVMS